MEKRCMIYKLIAILYVRTKMGIEKYCFQQIIEMSDKNLSIKLQLTM